jgi:tetratricopeptide (TPR) repeat protein
LSSQYLASDPEYQLQHSKILSNLSLQLGASKRHQLALPYAQEAVELNRALLLNGNTDTYPSNIYTLITHLLCLRDIFIELDDLDSRLSVSQELFTLLKHHHATDFSRVNGASPKYLDYLKGELVFDIGRDLWSNKTTDKTSQAIAVDALRFCSEYLPPVAGQEVSSLMVLNDIGFTLRRHGKAEGWVIPTMVTHARKWFESGAISVSDFTQTLVSLAADQYQRGCFEEALDTLEEALRLLLGHIGPALEAPRTGVRTGVDIEPSGSSPTEHAIAFYLYALEMKQALLVLKAKGQGVSPQGALEAALGILDKIKSTLTLFPAPKFYRARIWSEFYWRPKVLLELGENDEALNRDSSADSWVGSIDSVDVYSAAAVMRGTRLGIQLFLQHLRPKDDQEAQQVISDFEVALEELANTESVFLEVEPYEYWGTLFKGDHDFWPHDRSMISDL